MGLARFGFEVTGVDSAPIRNYPFEFIQADAMEFRPPAVDLIWASPPCQAYSHAAVGRRNAGVEYPDLLAATRAKLEAWAAETGGIWIIENTPGAPMRGDVMLCGSMFGLRLIRHRYFETNWPDLILTPPCQHPKLAVCVVGNGTPNWVRRKNGGKGFGIEDCRKAMGIDWMNRGELSQAIPPAYSEFLARAIFGEIGRNPATNRPENA